jgi:Alw26I/Eco31I/Esp3I family type II restriction m6 adenine DNA methyltransferase
MDKVASALRSRYTKQFYGDFLDSFEKGITSVQAIEHTLFKRFIDSGSLEKDETQRFAYNVYITKKILDSLYREISSFDDVFLISKVVEQGYFKLVKDFDALTLENNLSISKEFGAFFTPPKIAREMAKKAVDSSTSKVIIDPCCGTGNLLAACLEYSAESGVHLKKLIGVELDELSASVCEQVLNKYKSKLGLNVEIEIIVSDSLNILSSQGELFERSFEPGTFIINPPYGKLKFDSDKLTNSETRLLVKGSHIDSKKANAFESQVKTRRALNGLGVGKSGMEWSKIFLVLCSNNLVKGESLIFIGPCGWLNSVSQSEIRRHLFEGKMFSSIHFISESKTGFETVNQPLAIVCLDKGLKNKTITIINDSGPAISVKYDQLATLEKYNYPIPRINFDQLKIFIKLQSNQKIKDIAEIKNLRGELDLSINKSILTNEKTSLRVIRGENIGRYRNIAVSDDRTFYADEAQFFAQLGQKPKGSAYQTTRIVGRQCSYMKQRRRLIFDVIGANNVVSNSCNYITVKDDFKTLFYLALLNSALFDWYFRVLNGNNHVANYEIDDFPVPKVDSDFMDLICKKVTILRANKANASEAIATTYAEDEYELEALIFEAFKLSKTEAKDIMAAHTQTYSDKTIEAMYEY